MKIRKNLLAAIMLSCALPAALPAAEINALNKASVLELTAALPVPQPAIIEFTEDKTGLDPVVITVPGLRFGEIGWGPLELSHFLHIIDIFFPGKMIGPSDLSGEFADFNAVYFALDTAEAYADLARTTAVSPAQRAMPDNYLEQKLTEIPGYANHNIVITPFAWSRDPGDTVKTVVELEKKIIATYDAYKKTGRPVYILAHSWGSVLTHEALHNIEVSRPDVTIDKLITAGSPLIPANFVVKLFLKFEIYKQHLDKAVTKPAGVKLWHNIWASRDAYSNTIPAADANYQVDAEVENVEPTLLNLILHNKLLKKQARKDLFKIRDLKAWHGSYFFDYSAELLSINKHISVSIFRPVLAPQVVDLDKVPAPAAR